MYDQIEGVRETCDSPKVLIVGIILITVINANIIVDFASRFLRKDDDCSGIISPEFIVCGKCVFVGTAVVSWMSIQPHLAALTLHKRSAHDKTS